MVLLPGTEGRRDPERAAAAQRQRERFARDVGDEAGVAWAHEPRRRRRKFTTGTFVVLVVFGTLGALPLIFYDGDSSLIEATCSRPGIEASPDRLQVGESFAWQAAGPEAGPYVVTLDATAVTEDAAGAVRVTGGQLLAGPTGLPGCRSAKAVAAVGAARGAHDLTLFRRTGGRWERSAVAVLRVS